MKDCEEMSSTSSKTVVNPENNDQVVRGEKGGSRRGEKLADEKADSVFEREDSRNKSYLFQRNVLQ